MVAIKNLIVLASAVAASVIPRDAAGDESRLQTINSDVQAVISATNNYNGNVNDAIPIQNAESTLVNDIKSANSYAQSGGAISSSDASTIINYISSTLEPSVSSAINALIAKHADFVANGIQGVVLSDLKDLKNQTDSYGATLISSAPASSSSSAQAALNKIDADIQNGINAFSS